ncbi:c-type cytochrome [Aestuariivirga sp.]|jgi:cytochrome c|uniref:c-type cytochrome n=1 Tax=Aestuariivirga sp. TaxID=2650926 RepID=UPI0037831BF2
MFRTIGFTALAAIALLAVPAHAEGDAAAGEKVFAKCKACHEVEKGVNKVGPTLKGVVGRAAGAVPDYKYSEAMLAKGAEGLVWDEASLTGYLADPKGFIPKNKMAFAGLKKPDEIANVIAYLKGHP